MSCPCCAAVTFTIFTQMITFLLGWKINFANIFFVGVCTDFSDDSLKKIIFLSAKLTVCFVVVYYGHFNLYKRNILSKSDRKKTSLGICDVL